MITNIQQKATSFEQLHKNGETFIMANAWNAGSAVILEQAEFKAIGTTSAGIAFSHALPDYEGLLSFGQALEETQKIVQAVNVPVSMDAENGYGDSPEDVFDNMKMIASTGVCGANIEDHPGSSELQLYDFELAADRIRAAKESTSELDYPFMLTARAECYLTSHPDAFAESVKRVNRYREAGADCLFVPGIKDIETIKQLVKETDAPINVVMGLSGTPITLSELRDAGVTRISIGGSLASGNIRLNPLRRQGDVGNRHF